MKKILVVCLLGIGMMLPALQTTAKGGTNAKEQVQRIVNCTLEEDILIATSGYEDGAIIKVVITNNARQVVINQPCGTYHCEVYLGGLPAGNYNAQVHTKYHGIHAISFVIEE